MSDNFLTHLRLTRWPFSVVPDKEQCTYLADRERLHSDLLDLLSNLSRHDTSSIHIFWAWFGAGKTHTLYYLANKATGIGAQEGFSAFHTVYCEFPKAARSFVEVYRSFVSGIETDLLIDSFLEVCTCSDASRLRRELETASLDLFNALQVLASGVTQDQIIALRWLRAEPLPISEYRRIGISQKISNVEEASKILAALLHLLRSTARAQGWGTSRVLWLLDEFQRIESLGSRVINEINAGLHSTFNACPKGLSLFLSFSGKPQSNLPAWFSPELRDRIGRTKVIVLPPMLSAEAILFVKDVLNHYRTPNSDGVSPFFPFEESTCKVIVDEIEKAGDIKPRAIMQAFSAVLEEADRLIERGEMNTIGPQFAGKVLSERIVLTDNGEV